MIKTARQLKDLIRNLSKDKSADAQILMRNYMMERFLERISLSEYRDKFILKGGMLVAAMVGLDARSTMDIDATVKGATVGIEDVENMIASIISVPVDDGVGFRVKRISEIMDEAEYPGIRVSMETEFDGVISCHVLAPVLKEFKAVYPSISIEIREDDDGVTAMLMRNEIDFGFADAPVPRGFDSILIRRDPFLAVVAENSPLAAMDTIPLSTFQHEPTILCDEGRQKEATSIFRRNKITPRVEYTSRDDNLILSLIENGLCIGYMGQLVLNKTPYHVVSRPTDPQVYRDIVLAVRSIENAPPATAHLIDFIRDYLARQKED